MHSRSDDAVWRPMRELLNRITMSETQPRDRDDVRSWLDVRNKASLLLGRFKYYAADPGPVDVQLDILKGVIQQVEDWLGSDSVWTSEPLFGVPQEKFLQNKYNETDQITPIQGLPAELELPLPRVMTITALPSSVSSASEFEDWVNTHLLSGQQTRYVVAVRTIS